MGSFYSAFVPKADGTATSLETSEKLVEEGGVFYFQDDINDVGGTPARIYYVASADPYYVAFIYEKLWQPCMGYELARYSVSTDWSRSHYPFAVIHGHDRESYCAGYHEVEKKVTKTTKTENANTLLTAIGNISNYLGFHDMYYGNVMSIVGQTDVVSITYPRVAAPSGGVEGPVTFTEETTTTTKLVSKLVLGNQVFDLPSSGFGYYGPDALNFLHFRAAASAFGDSGVPKTMRSPDFQDLHLRTNCGSYTTTDVSNSFVGVI